MQCTALHLKEAIRTKTLYCSASTVAWCPSNVLKTAQSYMCTWASTALSELRMAAGSGAFTYREWSMGSVLRGGHCTLHTPSCFHFTCQLYNTLWAIALHTLHYNYARSTTCAHCNAKIALHDGHIKYRFCCCSQESICQKIHCRKHMAYYSLHTAHWHTARCTVHTASCTMHSAVWLTPDSVISGFLPLPTWGRGAS